MSRDKLFTLDHQRVESFARAIADGDLNTVMARRAYIPIVDPMVDLEGWGESGKSEMWNPILETFGDIGSSDIRCGKGWFHELDVRFGMKFSDGEGTFRVPRFTQSPTQQGPETTRVDEGFLFVDESDSTMQIYLDDSDRKLLTHSQDWSVSGDWTLTGTWDFDGPVDLGGATLTGVSLDDLDDVSITAAADKDLLQYDSGSSKWVDITVSDLEAQIDHGGLLGLTDDDHTQYLLADGSRSLSANWDVGGYEIQQVGAVLFGPSGGNAITVEPGTLTVGKTAKWPDHDVWTTTPDEIILAAASQEFSNKSVVTPNIKGSVGDPYGVILDPGTVSGSDKTITVPNETDTMAVLSAAQTNKRKTFSTDASWVGSTNVLLLLKDDAATRTYKVLSAGWSVADRDLTIPDLGQDSTFSFLEEAETYTAAKTFSSGLSSDTISEKTAAAGVTVDGLLIKDGGIAASGISSGTLAHERGGLEADVSAYSGFVHISGGATSAIGSTGSGNVVRASSPTITSLLADGANAQFWSDLIIKDGSGNTKLSVENTTGYITFGVLDAMDASNPGYMRMYVASAASGNDYELVLDTDVPELKITDGSSTWTVAMMLS